MWLLRWKRVSEYCFLAKEVFTARKRSLGQGNVFTGICLSTGGGLASQNQKLHDQGASASSRGVCIRRGLHPGRGLDRPPSRYMGYYGIRSTSGRYASYWNAFLLSVSNQPHVQNKTWDLRIIFRNRRSSTNSQRQVFSHLSRSGFGRFAVSSQWSD